MPDANKEPAQRHIHILAMKVTITLDEPFEIPEWQLNAYRASLEKMFLPQMKGKVTVDLQYRKREEELRS